MSNQPPASVVDFLQKQLMEKDARVKELEAQIDTWRPILENYLDELSEYEEAVKQLRDALGLES